MSYDPVSMEILKAVAQHSERWRNIVLSIPIVYSKSLMHVKGHLPNLQSISISISIRELSESVDVYRYTMSSIAPQLRSLSLNGNCGRAFDFFTDHMTSLHVRREDVTRSVALLQRTGSPRVTECTFDDLYTTVGVGP